MTMELGKIGLFDVSASDPTGLVFDTDSLVIDDSYHATLVVSDEGIRQQ